MRNYIWISDFKSEAKIYNLDVFDDEYFIILRNNNPKFIAFPNTVTNVFNNKFFYEADSISVRDFIKKWINIPEKTVMHLLKDNSLYYNIILYWREEANFIENYLIQKTRKEHLLIINNSNGKNN